MPKNKRTRFKTNARDIYLPFNNKRSSCLKTWFPRGAVDTSSEWCYLDQIKHKKRSPVLTAPHVGLTSIFKCFCTTPWEAFLLCCPGLNTWAQVLPCCGEPLLLSALPAREGRWEVASCLTLWLVLECLGINSGGQNFRPTTSREDSLHWE